MSLSASGDGVQSAIIKTPSNLDGDDPVTKELDATEDREIVGYHLHPTAFEGGISHDMKLNAWLGSDPLIGSDSVNQGEQFVAEAHVRQTFDDTNGNASSTSFGTDPVIFDEPFDWDEHVTLTVRHNESTAGSDASVGRMTVYYREV